MRDGQAEVQRLALVADVSAGPVAQAPTRQVCQGLCQLGSVLSQLIRFQPLAFLVQEALRADAWLRALSQLFCLESLLPPAD